MLTDNQYYLMNMALNHLGDIPDHPGSAYDAMIMGVKDARLRMLALEWLGTSDDEKREMWIEATGPDNKRFNDNVAMMVDAAESDPHYLGLITQRLCADYGEQLLRAHVNEWHNKVLAREALEA